MTFGTDDTAASLFVEWKFLGCTLPLIFWAARLFVEWKVFLCIDFVYCLSESESERESYTLSFLERKITCKSLKIFMIMDVLSGYFICTFATMHICYYIYVYLSVCTLEFVHIWIYMYLYLYHTSNQAW